MTEWRGWFWLKLGMGLRVSVQSGEMGWVSVQSEVEGPAGPGIGVQGWGVRKGVQVWEGALAGGLSHKMDGGCRLSSWNEGKDPESQGPGLGWSGYLRGGEGLCLTGLGWGQG